MEDILIIVLDCIYDDNATLIKEFLKVDFGEGYDATWKMEEILGYLRDVSMEAGSISDEMINAIASSLPSNLQKQFNNNINDIYS